MGKQEDFKYLKELLERHKIGRPVTSNEVVKKVVEIENKYYKNIDIVVADKITEEFMAKDEHANDRNYMYVKEEVRESERAFREAYKISLLELMGTIITAISHENLLIMICKDAKARICSIFISKYDSLDGGETGVYRLPIVPEVIYENISSDKKHLFKSYEDFSAQMHSSSINNFCIVNKVLSEYQDATTTTLRVESSKNKSKKSKSKSKRKDKTYVRYIKIDAEKVKYINKNRATKDANDKRNYERHTEEWTRAGHYRHYKNGKVVWIDKSKVRAKSNIKDKSVIYKLT